jgi:formamidopyrimidine-DNA glycosylase
MASEICARSGILPTRPNGNITSDEISKIKNSINIVIKGAIETKGTTFSGGYRDANGEKGEGLKHLVVFYQEYCQMCLENNIKTKIIKITLGQRGTYYCPRCQH